VPEYEQRQTSFLSAFRSESDPTEMAARLSSAPDFRTSFAYLRTGRFQWSGTIGEGNLVEIWSVTNDDLFGLSISPRNSGYVARASAYFTIRQMIHQVLETRLVVTSIVQEILATFHAKRDILELDGQNLRGLPPQIGMLTELRVLSLSNNELTCLPPEIGHLSKLTELILNNNRLKTLPVEVCRLTSLHTLLLSGNDLCSLPANIGDLARLRTLKLDKNQLCVLPAEIGKLTKLQTLSVQNNRSASTMRKTEILTNATPPLF
jgi:Leucine-rich repeat (LRR) protein